MQIAYKFRKPARQTDVSESNSHTYHFTYQELEFCYPSENVTPNVNVYNDVDCQTLKVVYRGVTDDGPPELNNLFNIYQPNRTLRSQDQMLLLLPKTRLIVTEKDIAVRGCKYSNPIRNSINNSSNMIDFTCIIKPYSKCYL